MHEVQLGLAGSKKAGALENEGSCSLHNEEDGWIKAVTDGAETGGGGIGFVQHLVELAY